VGHSDPSFLAKRQPPWYPRRGGRRPKALIADDLLYGNSGNGANCAPHRLRSRSGIEGAKRLSPRVVLVTALGERVCVPPAGRQVSTSAHWTKDIRIGDIVERLLEAVDAGDPENGREYVLPRYNEAIRYYRKGERHESPVLHTLCGPSAKGSSLGPWDACW